MPDTTRTTTALLDGLCDPLNDEMWSVFDRRYRPILIAFARKLGMADADAADVAQDTLAQFVKEYRLGRYDRERGRLRSWLIGLAKYRVLQIHRLRAKRKEVHGESVVGALPDDQELTLMWEEERRKEMLREALFELREGTKTREKTIQAFELLVIHQVPPEQVATDLEMTVQDVYLSKSRVAQRLRGILRSLDTLFDAGG